MKTDYAAQCRFFSAEDACRIALQAYFTATKHIEPPSGEAWFAEDGSPYASATDFVDAFSGEVQARLALLALEKLGTFHCALEVWNLYKLAADIEPEKMAPIIASREIELAQIDADCLGVAMNDLPPEDNAAHNQPSTGVGNAG